MQFWSSWLLKNYPPIFDANRFQKFPSLWLMQQSESTTGFFREKDVKYTLCSGEPPQSNRFLIVPTMGPRLWCKGIVMQSSSIRSPRNQISRPSKATFYHKFMKFFGTKTFFKANSQDIKPLLYTNLYYQKSNEL